MFLQFHLRRAQMEVVLLINFEQLVKLSTQTQTHSSYFVNT